MNAEARKLPECKALVVGLGDTGYSCVRNLRGLGCRVQVIDTRARPPRADDLARDFPEVPMGLGQWDPGWLRDPGMLVVSPGVSLREPWLAAAIERGAEPVGDIELFVRQARAPILAITGTNGKSTVTALTGAMCAAGGLRTEVGGNIGVPALDLLERPVPEVYVLELSSFQLETTWSLDARAATVLNLDPDHMDRYRDFDEYGDAKRRIFGVEGRGTGTMVLNRDDPHVTAMAEPGRKVCWFGLGAPLDAGMYGLVSDQIMRGDARIMPVAEIGVTGAHNVANVMAAMSLAGAMGVSDADMAGAARAFRGLAHRTELVLDKDGVRWMDDSKGTNVGATIAALKGLGAPVVLIAGGDGKGQDFSGLRKAVAAHARACVLIGRDGPLIQTALQGVVPVRHAIDMFDAVRVARGLAESGDVVLLSPACASFDMFRNYEHRAEVFRQAVGEIVQ